MKVNRSNIEKNLPKKGFRKDKSSHHVYFYHEYKGRETGAYTYLSHSTKLTDITGDLLLSMRKQLKLDNNKDVVNLCNCPMEEEEYNKVLIDKNIFEIE